MRWAWLAFVPLAGCAPTDLADPSDLSDKSDRSEAGWVIRGTKPAKLLLTNGSFGLWIKTDEGPSKADAFRMLDGALVPVLGFRGPYQIRLLEAETLEWSFDLRTGEFVATKKRGGRTKEIRVVLHPTRPVGAVKTNTKGQVGERRHIGDEPALAGMSGAEAHLPLLEFKREADTETRVVRAYPAIDGELSELKELTIVSRIGPDVFGVFGPGEDTKLPASYENVLAASNASHEEFWKTDIEVDGPAEDQLAIRTMLYYLRRGATSKLPPFGPSNAKYRGARFWDAEAWMLPVLALVDRDKAKAATQWRIDNLGKYVAWEAAVGRRDITPKEFGNALHVAGWVAWWTNRATDLGLVTVADEKKVLGVAFPQFYMAATDSGRGMEIKGVESPDEGRLRDNDIVTNILAKRVARLAADHGIADGEDLEWFKSIVLPKAIDGLPATYDNDLLKGYQQTAALLAIYPLQEDFGKGVADKMFDRYADLTSEVGPAMSESVHATIAARLGRKDAYIRWRKSWQTFTDTAMMFHERRNKQDAYFMTGAAGCLQTVLFGFAGLRLTDAGRESAMSKPLPDGYPVAFRPSLPPEWKSVTLRNIFLGRKKRATVAITHTGIAIY